jgi:perosamine synthetase
MKVTFSIMKSYPLFRVHIKSTEALAHIGEVFKSGFINEGTQVTQLHGELCKILDTNNLVLMNSCTSALTIALKLCEVKRYSEVISTPMTCVATNTPIMNLGGTVIWADVDPKTGMLDPQNVARKITRDTKAVMAVAWAGTPPKLQELYDLCRQRGVKLILDAAHAFGAMYKGQPIHKWADFTCYSFQAIKHFTTGDGGALICNNDADHDRAKSLKWFGLDRDKAKDEKGDWKGQQWDVDIEEAGYKFNMNNVSAAIGLSQVPYVDEILGKHRLNAILYEEFFVKENIFDDFKCVAPVAQTEGVDYESSFWVYTMKVNPEYSRLTRDQLLNALNAEGIMAGVVHVPNDDYTAFSHLKSDLPGVREFSANQFSLPCGWWLSDDDVRHIATRVKELTR